MNKALLALGVLLILVACSPNKMELTETMEPAITVPNIKNYAVGSTNLAIAKEFSELGDDTMHRYLIGQPDDKGKAAYLDSLLAYPEAAFVTDLAIPNDESIFDIAAGQDLPIVSFITYPTAEKSDKQTYEFPYMNSSFGVFEHMLKPGDAPQFADPHAKYPLIILSHGHTAHGVYDISHAHNLSRNGYIVVVIFYGDNRTLVPNSFNTHQSFMRPIQTKVVLDAVLASDVFGPHIDTDNIGISGHSFGGFTPLALAGGDVQGRKDSTKDSRIKAVVAAAPWVGGTYDGNAVFAFGDGNKSLANVHIPVMTLFGTKDDVTTPESILPATLQLSGERYVVELIDQPHVFIGGSWQDRDNWELLFFNAYLKGDSKAKELLREGASMAGGNMDKQWFDYQRVNLAH